MTSKGKLTGSDLEAALAYAGICLENLTAVSVLRIAELFVIARHCTTYKAYFV
jgi:hypothetical protein